MPESPPNVGVRGCEVLAFPVIPDQRGNLTFVEETQHVPFEIRRVFYLYDVPGGETRAGHALKTTEQVLIAMSGSFDVVLDDGSQRDVVTLNRSYFGLYIPPMTWRELENFSSGAVCLALAALPYDEGDYFRKYKDFHAAAKSDGAAR
jgi:WxcM-like, C-terminal